MNKRVYRLASRVLPARSVESGWRTLAALTGSESIPRIWVFSLAAALGAALGVPPGALGQQSQPAGQEAVLEACKGTEHRQFDFWLGDWEVTDTAGVVVGSNRITRVAGGCGLLESWRGAGGGEGSSLNWYEPQTGRWNQVWVGLGIYLRLTGGIEGGNMVLAGERQTPQGGVIDRIGWIPLDDGRVRQVWKASRDSGKTWQVLFDGMYARR